MTNFNFKQAYIDIRKLCGDGEPERALDILIASNELTDHRVNVLIDQLAGARTLRNHAISVTLELSEYWNLTDVELENEIRRISTNPVKYISKHGICIVGIEAVRIALFHDMPATDEKVLLEKKFNDLVEEFYQTREKYRDNPTKHQDGLYDSTYRILKFYTHNMNKK